MRLPWPGCWPCCCPWNAVKSSVMFFTTTQLKNLLHNYYNIFRLQTEMNSWIQNWLNFSKWKNKLWLLFLVVDAVGKERYNKYFSFVVLNPNSIILNRDIMTTPKYTTAIITSNQLHWITSLACQILFHYYRTHWRVYPHSLSKVTTL